MSVVPLPRRSAAAICTTVSVIVVTSGAANVPSPLLRRTEIVALLYEAVAMSAKPSPLKSARSTWAGAGAGYVSAVMNVVELQTAAKVRAVREHRRIARSHRFMAHLIR